MKHRFCCVLICCVLLFSMTLSAYAAGTTEYTLDELGMTVSMPSGYIVFTRDINDYDPNLATYGLTKDSMSSLMNERNIYLNGWDEDINQEVIITMIDSPLIDFNLYSDTTLSTMATSFESEYESAGVTVIKSEIYQHSQAKFLKIYISQPNGDSTAYGLQYYTVYADKAINITMQSYSGQITSSEEAILKSIVDSAIFDTAPQTAEADYTPTSSFTYTDTKTQATFTVPANWVETPLSEERESIDVKFTSLEEDGMSIMYGSFDVWSEMTASERSGYSRSDVDNSIFTKSDIADIFGLSSNDIKLVTYGGNEYYTATVTSSTDAYGLSFTVTITHMLLVNNGYMYWFQFSGASDNELYNDFESLLSSLKFATSDSKGALDNSSDLTSQFSFGNILLSLLVTIIVYSLPIIIYRYAVRKAPVDRNKAKKITIIYGICAFVVMSALIIAINGSGAAGGAILLWSYVNYRVLTGGTSKSSIISSQETIYDDPAIEAQGKETNNSFELLNEEEELSTQKTTCEQELFKKNPTAENEEMTDIQQEPEIMYCHKCGNKLLPGSLFCPKCGTQVPSKDRE
ncbi:MAG TPA: zinc ribbon domain-containing protein [Tissierellia bacterium]|nr:zinc ribbon domain-containing protein [Tissierellia bacterium]